MQGRPFGVVIVELSGLDEVNRLRGYAAGDEKIREAAQVPQKIAARRRATACRYGGNRLALLVPGDETSTDLLASEIANEVGDSSRTAFSAWRPGDDGNAVLARARAGLG